MEPFSLARLGLVRMNPRAPGQPHRAASSLELFFDLVFVIAVSAASSTLHHLELEGDVGRAAGSYLMVFFAIWWAWMNFTWFATAFDTDDWVYRVTTLVQMAGVLVLAAGAEPAMVDGDFGLVTAGYVIMRLAMVTQWLRAAVTAREYRATALAYAVGILTVQVLWVVRAIALPERAGVASFLVLVACELAIPLIAERFEVTPRHARHITERYGLFTLILLGESLLASSSAAFDALHTGSHVGPLIALATSAFLITAGMWWVYFAREHFELVATIRGAFTYGYLHYVIFACAGAFSAGIEVALNVESHATELSSVVAAATVAVPVGAFMLFVWALILRPVMSTSASIVMVVLSLGVFASVVVPWSIELTAVLVAAIVVVVEPVRVRGRGE